MSSIRNNSPTIIITANAQGNYLPAIPQPTSQELPPAFLHQGGEPLTPPIQPNPNPTSPPRQSCLRVFARVLLAAGTVGLACTCVVLALFMLFGKDKKAKTNTPTLSPTPTSKELTYTLRPNLTPLPSTELIPTKPWLSPTPQNSSKNSKK